MISLLLLHMGMKLRFVSRSLSWSTGITLVAFEPNWFRYIECWVFGVWLTSSLIFWCRLTYTSSLEIDSRALPRERMVFMWESRPPPTWFTPPLLSALMKEDWLFLFAVCCLRISWESIPATVWFKYGSITYETTDPNPSRLQNLSSGLNSFWSLTSSWARLSFLAALLYISFLYRFFSM